MERDFRNCCETQNNLCAGNDKDNTILSPFFSLPPEQFALLPALIGIILTKGLNLDQQNSLGNFFQSLGQTILTSAGQAQLLQSNYKKDSHINQQIQSLKKQINELEQEFNNSI